MNYPFTDTLRIRITENLCAFGRQANDDSTLRRAAVAVVIVENPTGADACLLLTLRPRNIKRHRSQFALPGGRLDDGETTIAAALRELREEMGLTLNEADVLGILDDYPTRSGFCITPVVMWGSDAGNIIPDPGEVEQVYHIPLHELDSPDIPILSPPGPDGRQVLSALLPALGDRIYAPTAALLYQFREVAMNARPTRVAHYDQPEFARK